MVCRKSKKKWGEERKKERKRKKTKGRGKLLGVRWRRRKKKREGRKKEGETCGFGRKEENKGMEDRVTRVGVWVVGM
jgi:hypothetical protein